MRHESSSIDRQHKSSSQARWHAAAHAEEPETGEKKPGGSIHVRVLLLATDPIRRRIRNVLAAAFSKKKLTPLRALHVPLSSESDATGH
jgi:hypothetical protein